MKKKFLLKVLLLVAIMIFPLGLIDAQANKPVNPDNPIIAPTYHTLESYAILPGQGGLQYGTPSNHFVAINPHNGKVYISYYNAKTHKLALVSEAPGSGNCGTGNDWYCRDLTTSHTEDMGRFNSIAFWRDSSKWKMGISFVDESNAALWFYEYSCVGSNCSSSIDQIDYDENWDFLIGGYNSLKYDSNGTPHISYSGSCNPAKVRCMEFPSYNLIYAFEMGSSGNCGPNQTWQCDAIDSSEEFGFGFGYYNSLAIDSIGKPHISYYDEFNGNLKYASKLSSATGNCGPGNTWKCQDIDAGANDVGLSTSLNIETGTDLPTIAYYDKTAGKLKFAKNLGGPVGNCGLDSGMIPRWDCQDIEYIGSFSTPPAIATDLYWTNDPLIIYESFADEFSPAVVREASPNPWSNGNCGNTQWNCKTLAAGGNSYVNEGDSVSVVYRNLYLEVIVWDEYDDYYSTRALRVSRDFEMLFLPNVMKE